MVLCLTSVSLWFAVNRTTVSVQARAHVLLVIVPGFLRHDSCVRIAMAGPCGPSAVCEKLMELDGGSTNQRRARRFAEIGLPPCFPTRRLCSDWPASTYAGCGCDKLHWQRTECSDWLAMEGLLWPQQVISLSDVGIQTKADLGAMFLDEAEAA